MKSKIFTLKRAQKCLPRRKKLANKSHGGKCLVVAGSQGLWGASILCGEAALRVGAGYVYLSGNDKICPIHKHPDFLWTNTRSLEFSKYQAIALGPGYKKPALMKKMILAMIHDQIRNVVLDAEALQTIALLKIKLPATWILTPHEGELGQMLQVSSNKIRSHRKRYAELAQKKWGCIVLLKGFQTLVATESTVWRIETGNPALAKAGTGDVLTGMIAGFLCQGVDHVEAACLAAFVHGTVADQWLKTGHDSLSLMASDINRMLPEILFQVRS